MKLKLLRVKRNLSQEELHERSGVGRDTISRIESGKTRNVQVKTLRKLSDALDVEPDELLEG